MHSYQRMLQNPIPRPIGHNRLQRVLYTLLSTSSMAASGANGGPPNGGRNNYQNRRNFSGYGYGGGPRIRSQSVGPDWRDKYERLNLRVNQLQKLWKNNNWTSLALKVADAVPVYIHEVEVGWVIPKNKTLPSGTNCVCLTKIAKPDPPKKEATKKAPKTGPKGDKKTPAPAKNIRGINNLSLVNIQADVSGLNQILVIEPAKVKPSSKHGDPFGYETPISSASIPHTIKEATESKDKLAVWTNTLKEAISFAERSFEIRQARENPYNEFAQMRHGLTMPTVQNEESNT